MITSNSIGEVGIDEASEINTSLSDLPRARSRKN